MSEVKLTALEKEVAKIDQHLSKTKKSAPAKAVPGTEKLCAAYAKAAPIVSLLGIILGGGVGAVISSLDTGIKAFCELPTGPNLSAADARAKSKAIANLCKVYSKAAPFVTLAIGLFKPRNTWAQALIALDAAITSLCVPEA